MSSSSEDEDNFQVSEEFDLYDGIFTADNLIVNENTGVVHCAPSRDRTFCGARLTFFFKPVSGGEVLVRDMCARCLAMGRSEAGLES